MTVLAPPRPPTPDDPRTAVERRREQEALIKEARRRTRRRRQRSAALVLLAVLLAGATGPSHSSGGNTWRGSSAAGPAAETKAARNGKLAFADDLGQLQVIDPGGSASVIAHCPRSPRGCDLAHPAWSPDGRQIAYVSGSIGLTPVPRGRPLSPRGHPSLSLYVNDTQSGGVRRLAGCGSCATQYGAAGNGWSPDGSSIAFSRDSGPRGTQSLWLVDTADGTLRRLTDCRPQSCVDVSPAWAPSGQLIVFSRLADGRSALYTVRPDGTELTKLTTSPFAENPQWSPDGRQIAFDGDNQIYITDADGSNQKLLFRGSDGNGPGVPSWSPDGTKLAFFNTPREPNRFFSAEVWTMNPDGSAKKRLYHSVCCVMNWAAPIWSPDGKKLAFATTSAVGVFVINPNGSGLRRLSHASTSALSWQRLP